MLIMNENRSQATRSARDERKFEMEVNRESRTGQGRVEIEADRRQGRSGASLAMELSSALMSSAMCVTERKKEKPGEAKKREDATAWCAFA